MAITAAGPEVAVELSDRRLQHLRAWRLRARLTHRPEQPRRVEPLGDRRAEHIAGGSDEGVGEDGMSIGRKATLNAAKVLATTGLDLLTDPDFVKTVQDDFVKRLSSRTYQSLNDVETSPLGKLAR
jgi:hypothetical protein